MCCVRLSKCFALFLKESNGPTDSYAAIAQVDIQRQEPESLRKWREEQKARLEALGQYELLELVRKLQFQHSFTLLSYSFLKKNIIIIFFSPN